MNSLLLTLAQNPLNLRALAVVAGIFLFTAALLARRRRRPAAVIGGVGLLLGVLLASVIVRHPNAFTVNAVDLSQLASVDLRSSRSSGSDWPQWRGVNRDGIADGTGFRTDWSTKPPAVAWKVPLGGGYSSFAIVGESAWTQDFRDGQERVVCLDITSGKERWSFAYTVDYGGFKLGYAKGPRATPTVHDGRVYTVGATGTFVCLDASPVEDKPKVHWQHELVADFDGELPTWGVACSPLIAGDLVIVQPGGRRGSIVAFDRISGTPRWASLTDPSGYSSPMVATLTAAKSPQIVALTGSRLVGLAAVDGRMLWEYDFPTKFNGNIATPVIAGDTVFISAAYGTGCALVKIVQSGSSFAVEPLLRQKRLIRTHHMTVVMHEDHLYGCDDTHGNLKCVNLRSAKEVWDTPRLGKGTLIAASGHLIHLSQDGALSLIEANPREYRLKSRLEGVLTGPECWALPAVAHGRILLRDSEYAVCLQ